MSRQRLQTPDASPHNRRLTGDPRRLDAFAAIPIVGVRVGRWGKSEAIPAPIQATIAFAFLVRARRSLWSMVPFAGTSPRPFLLLGGCADDLRSPYLYAAHRNRTRV